MVMWVVTEAVGGLFLSGVPLLQIVWTRYLFHLLLMGLILGAAGRFDAVRTRRPWLQIFRSLLMLMMPACYAFAHEAGTAVALGVFWIAPVLVLALAPLVADRPPATAWILTGLGWLGALLMYRPGEAALGWHGLSAIGMALSFSAYVVATRVLDRTEPLMTNLFYTAVGVFVSLSFVLPLFWVPMSARHYAGGALLASAGLAALYFLERALRAQVPSRLAPFFFVQALLEIVLMVADDGGMPALHVAAGALLTVFAIGIALLGAFRASGDETGNVHDRRAALGERQ